MILDAVPAGPETFRRRYLSHLTLATGAITLSCHVRAAYAARERDACRSETEIEGSCGADKDRRPPKISGPLTRNRPRRAASSSSNSRGLVEPEESFSARRFDRAQPRYFVPSHPSDVNVYQAPRELRRPKAATEGSEIR